MSVIECTGDLLKSQAVAAVNPVNTFGVMGAGLARQFAREFPGMVGPYRAACRSGALRIGTVLVYQTPRMRPRHVIQFPTKEDWRKPSRLEYIAAGLLALRAVVLELEVSSLAVPLLGCGLGGLDWYTVQPMITAGLGDVVDVLLYLPGSGAR